MNKPSLSPEYAALLRRNNEIEDIQRRDGSLPMVLHAEYRQIRAKLEMLELAHSKAMEAQSG